MSYEPRCTGEKVCSRCRRTWPVLAFSAEPNHTDGLASWCRDCQHDYNLRSKADSKTRAAMKNVTFSCPGGMERAG